VGIHFPQMSFEILYSLVDSLLTWTSRIRTVTFKVILSIFLHCDLLISQRPDEGLNLLQAVLAVLAILFFSFKCSGAVVTDQHFELLNG